jgi:hypothetical protein
MNKYMACSVSKYNGFIIGLILLIILALPRPVTGKREHPEKWYQTQWCEARNGQVEVVLPDGPAAIA